MMWQSAGVFNSALYHEVVLMNWARIKKIKKGRDGYKGYYLTVDCDPKFGAAFCIEGRPPRLYPIQATFPFDPTDKDQRRQAFKNCMMLWERK